MLMLLGVAASAQSLPEAIARDVMALSVRGEAVMRFLGFKVYDVRLWTQQKAFSHAEPFAIELVYDMNLNGRDIAERSVKEMRAQGCSDEKKLQRWGEEMIKIFPDIKPGDTLIGVSIPGKEARFYNREKHLRTVADPEFAQAFFDIWVSDKTSEPGLRLKLLAIAK